MSVEEEILKQLINHLEVGIHVVDKDGETIYYNESMGRIEGLKPEKVLGKKVVDVVKGLDEDNSTLMNALKNKKSYEDVIQKYKGEIRKDIITINTTVPVMLKDSIVAAIEISKDMTQLKELSEKICKLENLHKTKKVHYRFKDIITENDSMKKEINKAMKAALTNSSVLIYGETGCGKELFAQSIHYNGTRSKGPFIAINCAAIPSELLEGILFGTVKGSFTGAENRKGLFEEAHRGTILLDEINSMNTSLQSKLLRVLQEGYIRPLGSNKDIEIDVRVIATLNERPDKLIKEGNLRKDFYYRLSVVKINIPPLRERKDDISVIISHFIDYYNRILGKNIFNINEEVLKQFIDYNWPGNVRELKNMIESAINMVDDNITMLKKEHFETHILNKEDKSYVQDRDFLESKLALQDYLENVECKIIEEVLRTTKGNITKASEVLKISRQNLQYKIKKYKLL